MPVMTAAERDAFLDTPGILMRIATVSPAGKPLCVPIWYLRDGDRIVFTPRRMSIWLAHIRDNPHVCLCIDDQAFPYPKVVVEGRAEILYDLERDGEWRDTYRRIAQRYVPPDDAEAYIQETIDQTRALCGVSLLAEDSEVRTWRMPRSGESYKGIWADRYYSADAKIRQHEAQGTLPQIIEPD
jgi:nitroimidazol reductase NimA-like FMN-containing flavoprotein (pyridoxamine 5'-phosphate oxidase superfamily)